MSNATIAYLGPQGTYSDEAARLFAKKMGCDGYAQFKWKLKDGLRKPRIRGVPFLQ